MKNWNYWVPRVLAAVVALAVLVVLIPWDSVEPYFMIAASRFPIYVWLVGLLCVVHRRGGWIGWACLLIGLVDFAAAFVHRATEDSHAIDLRETIRNVEMNIGVVGGYVALIALLFFRALRAEGESQGELPLFSLRCFRV